MDSFFVAGSLLLQQIIKAFDESASVPDRVQRIELRIFS